MILSYVLIVLMITAIIVTVAVNYSREGINYEIRNFDERILHSASERIFNDIIVKGHNISLEIILMRGWAADPSTISEMMADKSAIFEFYTYIQNMVIRHPYLNIHVFFHKENAMISSTYGFKEFETRRFEGDFAWLDDALSGKHLNKFSIPLSNIYNSPRRNFLSMSINFPMSPRMERSLCTIIIAFDEEEVFKTLSDHFAAGYNSVYLLDASGTVLSSLDRQIVFAPALYYVESQINRSNTYGYHQFRQNGSDYILSYHMVSGTDWHIVNIISLHDFYQTFFIMRFNIMVISLFVILAVINIAVFLSRTFYKPVRTLEGALDQVNLRISDLQDIITSNATHMKQNFLICLLNDNFRSDLEINDWIALLSLSADYSRNLCFLLELHNEELDSMPLDKRQALKIGIIESLNDSGDGWYCIAGEYSGKEVVGALVFSDDDAEGKAVEHICLISKTMRFKLQIGGEVPKLSMLKYSLDQAVTAGQYRFFYPDMSIMHWSQVKTRHGNPSVLPSDSVAYFTAYCTPSPEQSVNELIMRFCYVLEELKNGEYDINYAKQVICTTMQTVISCITHARNTETNELPSRFTESFAAMDSVDYIRDWMVDYINAVYNKKNSVHSQEIIDNVKEIIDRNLAEDLSLDAIANIIYMSSKYLSRIFKNVTGLNLSEYITQRRISEACRLLEETRLSVEKIAERVGYHSSAYFIKCFKESKNCTPKQYRKSLINTSRSLY